MRASILLLPGDGIGPEVVAAARSVLTAVAGRYGHNSHSMTRPSAVRRCGPGSRRCRTRRSTRRGPLTRCLLGAVGDAAFDREPAHRRPEAALLAIRRELGLYANLRPATVWPGLESAGPLKPEILAGTDMLVVRELTGGLYYGEPRGTAADGSAAFNTMRYSRHEVERIARVAFDAARGRKKRVTSVDKANVLEVSRLWRAVVNEVARDYPDVTLDHQYVDACAMKIALAPSSFDVILAENMFGDILSDEAGAIVGSLGLLPSASLRRWSGTVRTGARIGAGYRRTRYCQPGRRHPLRSDAAASRAEARGRGRERRTRRDRGAVQRHSDPRSVFRRDRPLL